MRISDWSSDVCSSDLLVMLSIRERLHRLAGAAGTFGFAKLGERARQLEQRAARWLDSAKPGSRAAEAFDRAVLQLASQTPGKGRDGARLEGRQGGKARERVGGERGVREH